MSSRRDGTRRTRPAAPDLRAFQDAFDEPLTDVLNLATWDGERDPADELRRLDDEVERAIAAERDHEQTIRDVAFDLIANAPDAPPGAGLHVVTSKEILQTQDGLLFSGAVEACDGTNHTHDTLPMTIHHIGVALVSYRGEATALQTRLFRRDVRDRRPDPVQAVLELLERRGRRGALAHASPDPLSELAQRGLMTFAERSLLTDRATARWRMGHGSPAPLELLVSYFTDVTIESIKVIRRLVEHGRFVFVASEPADRDLLTIGQGLRPREYLIVGRLPDRIGHHLDAWSQRQPVTVDLTWDGEQLSVPEWVGRFRDEVAPRVVYGLYRATAIAPPQLFYAHVEWADVAARIALADSVQLEQRGFPLLIDLADHVCTTLYGGTGLRDLADAAYAASGAPFRYASERPTRPE